jgi:predicted phosphoribosyltransferase
MTLSHQPETSFKDRTDAGRQLSEHLIDYQIIDDGLASGYTMITAISSLRRKVEGDRPVAPFDEF